MIALGLVTAPPAVVSAKGFLYPGYFSPAQVSTTSPAGVGLTYATIQTGGGSLLLGIEPRGGEVEVVRRMPGHLSLPVTGPPQTTGLANAGVSANGETIALIGPVWRGHAATRIATFSASGGSLRLTTEMNFRGDYGIEGLSPDGQTLFVAKHGPGAHTEVFRIQLAADGQEPRAFTPARDPVVAYESTFGYPLAQHSDGRWTYRLYGGGPDTRPRVPRILALDALTGSFFQIELRELTGQLWPIPHGTPMLVTTGADPGLLAVLNSKGEVVASYDSATRATYYPLPNHLLAGS